MLARILATLKRLLWEVRQRKGEGVNGLVDSNGESTCAIGIQLEDNSKGDEQDEIGTLTQSASFRMIGTPEVVYSNEVDNDHDEQDEIGTLTIVNSQQL